MNGANQPFSKSQQLNWNIDILSGLLYLILPNILFLFGWFRLWISLPLSVMLLTAGWFTWKESRARLGNRLTYSIKDFAALLATLFLAFVVLETLGINGHIMQMGDFTVRNAIYYSLIEQPWPLFSDIGDYFIYYHIFWLPPALISKLLGTAIPPTIILYLWMYLGLCIFILMLFRKWRSKVLLLFLIICLLGSIVDNLIYAPQAYSHITGSRSPLYEITSKLAEGRLFYHFSTFYGNIFTFNAWVPSIVFMGMFWDKRIKRKDLVFIASLIIGAALFQCFPIALSILALFSIRTSLLMKVLKSPTTWCGVILGVCYLLFFSGQLGQESASGVKFILSENFPISSETKAFRYAVTVITLLLPTYLILPKYYRKNALFAAMLLIAFILPLLWIGRGLDELLLKSGQIYYMLFAYLLFLSWLRAGKCRKLIIIIFIAFSSIHVFGDLYRRDIQDYSWCKSSVERHILKYDRHYIADPKSMFYSNFHGIVKMPLIQYDKPGESPIK